jgi:hypothetical protein
MPAELSIDAAAAPAARPVRLRDRFRAHLGLKAGLLAALTVLFCVPYFFLGHLPRRTPAAVPTTAIDAAVPFDPRWVVAYQSLYLLIPLPPFLSPSRADLLRYVRAFTVLSALGFAIFFVYPTRFPRPADPHTSGLYTLLVTYDPPTNAFPSMHVALAVQSLLFGRTLMAGGRGPWRPAVTAAACGWLAAIAYATLATKQHGVLDVAAGGGLAAAVHGLFGRSRA